MQDVQNYQYYDPTPGLTPEPWWKRRKVWRLAMLTVLGLVVIALAVVATANVLQNRKLVREDEAQLNQADAVATQLATRCEEGDADCLARAAADGARAAGAAQACSQLEGDGFASCVTLIAQDKKDPEVCRSLSGADQQTCLDSAYLLLANAEFNLSLCSKISAPSITSACVTQVTAAAIADGRCAEAGIDPAKCEARQSLAAAIAAGNAVTCDALADEDDRYECNYSITHIDEDRDGLMLADEVSRGLSDDIADGDGDGLSDGDEVHLHLTDPAKADSDGDGFSDGTEIDSGYDPLK